MKTKNKLKTKLTTFLLALTLVFSACFGLIMPLAGIVFAYSPANYTKWDFVSSSTIYWNTNSNNASAFTSSASFNLDGDNNNSGLTKYDGAPDSYVLYVKADNAPSKIQDTEDETKLKDVFFYYETNSSSIELAKNSYYVLSYYCLTTGNATASIRISNGIEFESQVFSTASTWQKRYVFISTHADTKDNIKLNLQLGNKNTIAPNADTTVTGHVLFDEISIDQIDVTDYLNKTINHKSPKDVTGNADATADTIEVCNANVLTTTAFDTDTTANHNYSNFENGTGTIYNRFEEQINPNDYTDASGKFSRTDANTKDWYYYAPEDLSNTDKRTYYNAYNAQNEGKNLYFNTSIVDEAQEFKTTSDDGEVLGIHTFGENGQILKIENTNDVLDLGLVSSKTFKVKQFGVYRVSVRVKSKQKGAQATLMVLSHISTGEKPIEGTEGGKLLSQSNTSDAYIEGENYANCWGECVVYVRGYALSDLSARIALIAPAGKTIYFDAIKIEEIKSSAYNGSDVKSDQKLDLSSSSVLQTTTIPNGYFNFVTIDKAGELNYPLTPTSWTLNRSVYKEDDVVSGIVPTNTWDTTWFNGAINPLSSAAIKANILGIWAKNLPAQEDGKTREVYYRSSTDYNTIGSGKVCKVSVDLYVSSTETFETGGKVFVRLIYSDKTITDIAITPTVFDSWETYTFYVRAGSSSRSVRMDVGLSNTKGLIFVKEAKITALAEKSINGVKQSVDTQFVDALKSNNTEASQLNNHIRFVDFIGDAATTHTTETIEGKNYYKSLNYTVEEKKDGSNVVSGEIFIADITRDFNETITSSVLNRDGSKSGKVLVLINDGNKYSTATPLTSYNLAKSSFFKFSVWVKTSDVGEAFTIKFKNINTTFTKVNTTNVSENNGYVQYVAYVKTGENAISSTQIEFALGDSSNKVNGYALISDINIETITENNFKAATNNLTGNESTIKKVDFSSTAASSSTNTTDPAASTDKLVIFFVVFSSLVTAAALIIALVSIGVKKLPKNTTVVGKNQAEFQEKSTIKKPDKDGFV